MDPVLLLVYLWPLIAFTVARCAMAIIIYIDTKPYYIRRWPWALVGLFGGFIGLLIWLTVNREIPRPVRETPPPIAQYWQPQPGWQPSGTWPPPPPYYNTYRWGSPQYGTAFWGPPPGVEWWGAYRYHPAHLQPGQHLQPGGPGKGEEGRGAAGVERPEGQDREGVRAEGYEKV